MGKDADVQELMWGRKVSGLLSQKPAFAVHALSQGIIRNPSAEWVKRGLGILYLIDEDFPT